jgi:antitoxin CptB
MTALMADNTQDLEARRKKLLWRATHRGIKEMDMLLGGYARARVGAMTAAELDQLETIIDIPDHTLLAWATRQEAMPEVQKSPMLLAVLAHRP